MDQEQVLDFVLEYGREPENEKELIAFQEKVFNQLLGGY